MITTEKEYAFTRERVAARGTPRIMLAEMRRELAMWEAGIREPVSFPLLATATLPGLDHSEEQYEALPPEERADYHQRLAIAAKHLEINAIDEQIGIALDRIADWRRHRAWLEREISELAASNREPVAAPT